MTSPLDGPVLLTPSEQRRVLLEAQVAKVGTRLEELRRKAQDVLAGTGEAEGITTRSHPEPQPLVIEARLDLSRLRPDALVRVAEAFGQVVAEAQQVQAQLQGLLRELEEARAAVPFQVQVKFPDPA